MRPSCELVVHFGRSGGFQPSYQRRGNRIPAKHGKVLGTAFMVEAAHRLLSSMANKALPEHS